MESDREILLLQAMTLLQSVVLSCVDRKSIPFTRTQLRIFTVLSMEGELTMTQVAQHLASSKEQTTRTVAPLADAGYVERRIDPANRTRVYIRLTESGKQLLDRNLAILTASLSAKLDRSLREEEISALHKAAAQIVQLAEKIQ